MQPDAGHARDRTGPDPVSALTGCLG